MKKSVIILIGLIYVASIALVSFFGLQFKTFNEVIYVERIELENTPTRQTSDGIDEFLFYPDEEGNREFQLIPHVYPENASNQGVLYVYAKSENVTISETGLVTFNKDKKAPLSVTVTIKPQDGSPGAEKTILITSWHLPKK